MRSPTVPGFALALALLSLQCARAEPDAAALGKERGYPVGTTANWYGKRHHAAAAGGPGRPAAGGAGAALDRRPPFAIRRQVRLCQRRGYGYQFWLFPLRAPSFALQGVHGQAVFVQPSSGIVMVQTALDEAASGQRHPQPGRERDAFWRGVLQSLGGTTGE